MEPRTILIQFISGEKRQFRADRANVEDGVLKLRVFVRNRRSMQLTRRFLVKDIGWASLGDEPIVVGPEELSGWPESDLKSAAKRTPAPFILRLK